MGKRKVCVVLTTRGNYGKMKSMMRAFRDDSRVELQVIIAGAVLLSRYGDIAAAIERDGFTIDRRIHYILEGDAPVVIAQSAGIATTAFAQVLHQLQPDVLVLIGDRFETLSIALAAVCLNLPIAHVEGGEVSGSIDEGIRHAVTKLAHVHFAANPEAAERIVRLGEDPATVHTVGTPTLDLIAELDLTNRSHLDHYLSQGSDRRINTARDYVVVLQHPVVTEYEATRRHLLETVEALETLGLPAIWVIPNHDAGSDDVERVIQERVQNRTTADLACVKSMPLEAYAVLLTSARCLIGNSSSGIRECEFLGVPVVNIGTRQAGRRRGANVIDVPYDQGQIVAAARTHLEHGPYESQHLYGDGRAGRRIADVLATCPLSAQKRIAY